MAAMDEARQIREFWFGRQPLTAAELRQRTRMWFGDLPPEQRRELDEKIRSRFGALMDKAGRGELASWADSPRRRLSLILLLDQFPRNIYRGTARAFAHDAQALELALTGMQSGADAALDCAERMFFYMPLQHEESQEAQEESVAAFRRLLEDAPADMKPIFKECVESAEQHREIIARFGRFPHRNRALGRETTPEEHEFLLNGAQSFGQ